MLTKDQFNILLLYKNSENITQRNISSKLNISLGSVNNNIKQLESLNFISNNKITDLGNCELDNFKVDNAIIMAAGMSSRFAPLSYEKPKGLLKVKGEILIERQIEQLKAAGINDITVVVGYKKQMFFYLEEKYNVNIVVNEDYYRYNNPSTLMLVKDKLKNTYICSSDDYFAENVFEQYVYRAYYSAVYSEEWTDEYCITFNNKGLIQKVTIGDEKSWFMLGHVYFSKDFSEKFLPILIEEYKCEESRSLLWEQIYMKHIKELDMYIRKYDEDAIKEFDSLDELRAFDEEYINNTDSYIMKNICKVLNCSEKDIINIKPIKSGLTNTSFSFKCKGKKYVYRHPGVGTDEYINRKSEAFSMTIAKELGLDNTFLYMDEKEGFKISYFIDNATMLDYHNTEEVDLALSYMRKLHNFEVKSDYKFDIWEKSLNFYNIISRDPNITQSDLHNLHSKMDKLYKYLKNDSYKTCLCHCDCYNPNFLIDSNKNMYLIDWEYSGISDPAVDLGTFICCSDYTYEEAIEVITKYLQHTPSDKELAHFLGYISICSYYWYLWALYQESIGKLVGNYVYIWYKYCKSYGEKSLNLYERKE